MRKNTAGGKGTDPGKMEVPGRAWGTEREEPQGWDQERRHKGKNGEAHSGSEEGSIFGEKRGKPFG